MTASEHLLRRSSSEIGLPSVTKLTEDSVTLADGTVIPCRLVVWSTGFSPWVFTSNVDLPKNNRGQILTDHYLRVKGHDDGTLFAIGDCADIEDYSLPGTAQVAERQGRYFTKLLSSNAPIENAKPYSFSSMGMLAYIGGYTALTDLPKAKLQGFPSWLVWRSAYLTRLGLWRLCMHVPMDWLKILNYGRDISRF